MAHGNFYAACCESTDELRRGGQLRSECDELDDVLEIGGTIDGRWVGVAGLEERGVVGAFFGGGEVGSFCVGSQERCTAIDCTRFQGW